jgi:hypothetical protein
MVGLRHRDWVEHALVAVGIGCAGLLKEGVVLGSRSSNREPI